MNKIVRVLPAVISYIISIVIFTQLDKWCSRFQIFRQKIKLCCSWKFVIVLMGLMLIINISISEYSKNIIMVISGVIVAFVIYIQCF